MARWIRHETTGTALAFTVQAVLQRPDVLARIRAREPEYLDCVIKDRCV
jgi:cytochrome P450